MTRVETMESPKTDPLCSDGSPRTRWQRDKSGAFIATDLGDVEEGEETAASVPKETASEDVRASRAMSMAVYEAAVEPDQAGKIGEPLQTGKQVAADHTSKGGVKPYSREVTLEEHTEAPSFFASASRAFESLFGVSGGRASAESHGDSVEALESIDVSTLSIRELRKVIADAELSDADCFERSELRQRASEAIAKQQQRAHLLRPSVSELQIGAYKCYAVGISEPPELVVVFFHGYLAPVTELLPLASALARKTAEMGCRTTFLLPQSPGNTWFSLNISSYILAMVQGEAEKARVVRSTPHGVPEMRQKLSNFLYHVRCRFALSDNSKVCLAGFSQGAMVALDAALDANDSFAGVVLISGFVMAVERWANRLRDPHHGLRVLQLHGLQDNIIPFYTACICPRRLFFFGTTTKKDPKCDCLLCVFQKLQVLA